MGQVVELAVLDAEQQRLYLRGRIDEGGPVGVTGVPHRHIPSGQPRELHTGSLGVAVPALLPDDSAKLCGRHAVVHVVHRTLPELQGASVN